MKTPIPEKIKVNRWAHTDRNLIIELQESHNSLIDVLTEQQKEIESLKSNLYNFCTFMGKKDHPYTAMRSTGMKDIALNMLYEEPNTLGADSKPIKPKKDMLTKIAYLRQTIPDMTESERRSGWYLSGYYDAIDKLLAIVKGE